MSDFSLKEPIQFTDQEQFLISYYKSPELSSVRRTVLSSASQLAASVFFLAVAFYNGDMTWALVAYAILFYRAVQSAWQSSTWISATRGMIEKYDSRVRELASALSKVEAEAQGDRLQTPI